jgi:hypothetical protein
VHVTCGQTHIPELQAVFGAVQVETQVALPFASTPQVSHLFASQAVARQVLLHTLVFGQQNPAIQVDCPATHVETQASLPFASTPQISHLFASQAVVRQVLPQILVFGQHTPAMQVELAPQELPQPPQFCSSSRRFLQTPEQHASPARVLQASAHLPQLLLSF